MTFALTTAALLALATTMSGQERPWSFPELLRTFHIAAYQSGLCESDEIGFYTFNASGQHPSRAATTMSNLTYSIIGFRDDEVIAPSEDQNQLLAGEFPARQEVIRCVKSKAREQGATRFVVRLVNIDIHEPVTQ